MNLFCSCCFVLAVVCYWYCDGNYNFSYDHDYYQCCCFRFLVIFIVIIVFFVIIIIFVVVLFMGDNSATSTNDIIKIFLLFCLWVRVTNT